MEVKFDVIKPNLYTVDDKIYFSIEESSDIIPACRSIDEIVKKHIGGLKVDKTTLEVAESSTKSKHKKTWKYNVPLNKYLDAVERKAEYKGICGVTNKDAELFGLGYFVDATTMEDTKNIFIYRALQRGLANPKFFDEFEADSQIPFRLDRKKTSEEMKRLYQELEPKIPDNYAELVVIDGRIPFKEDKIKTAFLGFVGLEQLKAKDKAKIEETKSELIEKLKEVDGPCLSLDAPNIFRQMINLYYNAPEIVQKYGNILSSPSTWKTRLFIFDP